MDYKEFRKCMIKKRREEYDSYDSITEKTHHSGPRRRSNGEPIRGVWCCCRFCQRLRKLKRNFKDLFSHFTDYRKYDYIKWELSRKKFESDEECKDFFEYRLENFKI
jgi:hypothetical protein